MFIQKKSPSDNRLLRLKSKGDNIYIMLFFYWTCLARPTFFRCSIILA